MDFKGKHMLYTLPLIFLTPNGDELDKRTVIKKMNINTKLNITANTFHTIRFCT